MHKFISEYGEGYQPEKIEITVSRDASLTEMVESFTYYLKACGYYIPEGHALDFMSEDGWGDKGWDSFGGEVTEDFEPRSIDSVTPEEWNRATKNVS